MPRRNVNADLTEARDTLAGMVAVESHSIPGQIAMAQYIVDTARRYGLGDIRPVLNGRVACEFPKGAALSEAGLLNVCFECGNEAAEETVVLTAHMDTVEPDPDYAQVAHERSPYDLHEDPAQKGLYYGLGSYDMKGGIAMILMAMKRTVDKLPKFRKVRVVIVCREEALSEGMVAARMPGHDLMAGAAAIVNNEILVGAMLKDPPLAVPSRLGRVMLDVDFRGPEIHAGRDSPQHRGQMASLRQEIILRVARTLELPLDPEHKAYMKTPRAQVTQWQGGRRNPGAMSSASQGTTQVELHTSDRRQTPEDVRALFEEALRRELEAHGPLLNGDLDVRLQERPTPFPDPWQNPAGNELLRNVRRIARENGVPLTVRGGGAVAEESRHAEFPTLCLPLPGEDEHNWRERVDLHRAVRENLVVMVNTLLYPRPLTRKKAS